LLERVRPYLGMRERIVQTGGGTASGRRRKAKLRPCKELACSVRYRPTGATASSFIPALSRARRTLPEALASSMNALA
jgi:hypothetical protein